MRGPPTAEALAFAAALAPRAPTLAAPIAAAAAAATASHSSAALAILVQPFIRGSGALPLNASLRLNVEAARSVATRDPIAYEWRRNGCAVKHTRASRADLILRSIGFEDEGAYRCVVTCGAHRVVSDTVVLRVAGAAADQLLRARDTLKRATTLVDCIAAAGAPAAALLAARECEALRAECDEAATLAALPSAERARLLYTFARAAVEIMRAAALSSTPDDAAAARAVVAACDGALDALPGCAERAAVLRLRAEAHLRLGRFSRAIDDFEEAAAAAAPANDTRGEGEDGGAAAELMRESARAARESLREDARARWDAFPPTPRRRAQFREEPDVREQDDDERDARSTNPPPSPPPPRPPRRGGAAAMSHSTRFLASIGLRPAGPAAAAAVVRKAYRREARRRHPDKPGGGKEAFQALASEYAHYLHARSSGST